MTLTELCVVSAVILSMTFITLPFYVDYFAKDEVEIKARNLVNEIHNARIRAMCKCTTTELEKYGTKVVFYPNGRTVDAEFVITGKKYRAVVSLKGFSARATYKVYKENKHGREELNG